MPLSSEFSSFLSSLSRQIQLQSSRCTRELRASSVSNHIISGFLCEGDRTLSEGDRTSSVSPKHSSEPMAAARSPTKSVRASPRAGPLPLLLAALPFLLLVPLSSCYKLKGASAAAAASPSANASAVAPRGCAGNLVKNGGGESYNSAAGTFSYWTAGNPTILPVLYGTSGGYPGRAVSRAINGGSVFFGGAPGPAEKATVSQVVSVGQCLSCSGPDKYVTLSAFLGGFEDQEDVAKVTARFLSPQGKSLGLLSIGPVTSAQRKLKTALLFRSRTAMIPCKTATIRVTVTAIRQAEAILLYDDGYADNVSLTFKS